MFICRFPFFKSIFFYLIFFVWNCFIWIKIIKKQRPFNTKQCWVERERENIKKQSHETQLERTRLGWVFFLAFFHRWNYSDLIQHTECSLHVKRWWCMYLYKCIRDLNFVHSYFLYTKLTTKTKLSKIKQIFLTLDGWDSNWVAMHKKSYNQ